MESIALGLRVESRFSSRDGRNDGEHKGRRVYFYFFAFLSLMLNKKIPSIDENETPFSLFLGLSTVTNPWTQ